VNVICDTAIIANFLKINRIDLLARSSHTFLVCDLVQQEIAVEYPGQLKCFQKALKKSAIQKVAALDSQELDLFSELIKEGQLSPCECATLAIAAYRGYFLASDDSQATLQAELLMAPNRILRTQNIVVAMIKENLLSEDSADQLLLSWAAYLRFKLNPSTIEMFPEDNLLQETSLQWGIFPLVLKSG
jgi:predicted nucleic acid-binding protein